MTNPNNTNTSSVGGVRPAPTYSQYRAPAQPKPDPALNFMLFGNKGEVKIESLDGEKEFTCGVFQDGIYEKRNTPVGEFVYKKVDCNIPYIESVGEASFNYKLPKLPKSMLLAIVEFFRDIMRKMRGSEVMVQIWWDKEKEEYSLYVPEQKVSGATIDFQHSKDLQEDENKVWVLDIHSHNTMGAFFSGTDSSDEVSTRVFGVIGTISDKGFSSVWRAGVNGKFQSLKPEDIWELEDSEEELDLSQWKIPESDYDKVKEMRTYVNNRYTAYNKTHHKVGNSASKTTPTYVNGNSSRNSAHSARFSNANQAYLDYLNGLGGLDDLYLDDEIEELYNSHNPRTYSAANSVRKNSEADVINDISWYNDVKTMQEGLDDLFESKDKGCLGTTELSSLSAEFIDFIGNIEEFNKTVAERIIMQISNNLDDHDFRSLVEKLNNDL